MGNFHFLHRAFLNFPDLKYGKKSVITLRGVGDGLVWAVSVGLGCCSVSDCITAHPGASLPVRLMNRRFS